ncbi:hypothetical protein CHU98_g7644 [Xylaria longipes]|nr:hypothetical protein CHU98_g7644 [Xylaria longipes]
MAAALPRAKAAQRLGRLSRANLPQLRDRHHRRRQQARLDIAVVPDISDLATAKIFVLGAGNLANSHVQQA